MSDEEQEFEPDDELTVLRNEYVSCHKLLDDNGIEDTHESGEAYSLFGRLCVFFDKSE